MKYSLGISDFLEEISNLSHSVVLGSSPGGSREFEAGTASAKIRKRDGNVMGSRKQIWCLCSGSLQSSARDGQKGETHVRLFLNSHGSCARQGVGEGAETGHRKLLEVLLHSVVIPSIFTLALPQIQCPESKPENQSQPQHVLYFCSPL